MKKTVSALAVLLALTLIFSACGKKDGDKTTAPSADVTTAAGVSDGSADITTAAGVSDGSDDAPASRAAEGSEAEIFNSGTFYMEGTMTSGEDVDVPVKMAINPESVYLISGFTVAENNLIELAILMQGDQKYIIYPVSQQYVELNATAMRIIGLDSSLLEFGMSNFQTDDTSKVSESGTEKIDGKEVSYDVFEAADGTSIRRYVDGDKLVRIETYDAEGKIVSTLNFDFVTSSIPDGMLQIPTSYTEVTVMKLLNTILSSVKVQA
ncbi:MAG: hypothetical protein K6C36_05585 [Clostridia bacterium]|nr:hypothetical protein [Clostridia bacterium]